jgi:hypothetical protein
MPRTEKSVPDTWREPAFLSLRALKMQFHPVDDAPVRRFYAAARLAPMWKRRLRL